MHNVYNSTASPSEAKVMSVAVLCCTALQPSPHKWSSLNVYYIIINVMLDYDEKIINENKMRFDVAKCSLS